MDNNEKTQDMDMGPGPTLVGLPVLDKAVMEIRNEVAKQSHEIKQAKAARAKGKEEYQRVCDLLDTATRENRSLLGRLDTAKGNAKHFENESLALGCQVATLKDLNDNGNKSFATLRAEVDSLQGENDDLKDEVKRLETSDQNWQEYAHEWREAKHKLKEEKSLLKARLSDSVIFNNQYTEKLKAVRGEVDTLETQIKDLESGDRLRRAEVKAQCLDRENHELSKRLSLRWGEDARIENGKLRRKLEAAEYALKIKMDELEEADEKRIELTKKLSFKNAHLSDYELRLQNLKAAGIDVVKLAAELGANKQN